MGGPALDKMASFDLNAEEESKQKNADKGRLLGGNRAERLEQVSALFNKIYTQITCVDDPPLFYKQTNQNGNEDSHDIDFVSSESISHITNYLKRILPTSLIGNVARNIDEYADNE